MQGILPLRAALETVQSALQAAGLTHEALAATARFAEPGSGVSSILRFITGDHDCYLTCVGI